MPIAVFGTYTALGNTLTLSKMALTSIMLNTLRSRIEMSSRLYDIAFNTLSCMERLYDFYSAPES